MGSTKVLVAVMTRRASSVDGAAGVPGAAYRALASSVSRPRKAKAARISSSLFMSAPLPRSFACPLTAPRLSGAAAGGGRLQPDGSAAYRAVQTGFSVQGVPGGPCFFRIISAKSSTLSWTFSRIFSFASSLRASSTSTGSPVTGLRPADSSLPLPISSSSCLDIQSSSLACSSGLSSQGP